MRGLLKKLYSTSPWRQILTATGVVLVLAGAGLLSWVAYDQFAGSDDSPAVIDIGDEAAAADILDDLPSPTPFDAPVITPSPAPAPPLGDSPYTIAIDKIGVNAPVQTFGLDENAVPVVPTGQDARDVVAWYEFSAKPGTGGNAVFAGHVTWNGRAVFYNLGTVQPGDTIRLRGQDGTEVLYNVTSVFSVDPDDPDSLKVMYQTDKDVITIITCGGSFTDTNDPVYGGEYNQRLVVRGDLMSVSGPSAAQPAAGG